MATILIDKLLQTVVNRKASDLHISVGQPPVLRLDGHLLRLETKVLEPEDTVALMKSISPERCQQELQEVGGADFGFAFGDMARFRVSIFKQRGNVGMVLRQIPVKLMNFKELGTPPVLAELCKRPRGLILVTGPTGCGKSTTLAALIDMINRARRCNIVTVEDPVEFVHEDNLAIVSQREVGIDTESFYDAMKYVVRESPDVILIGEMRDAETMRVALTAAETGHLVFSTVHTTSAGDTVERIVNIFPPHEKNQICLRLSTTLVGIISQKLVPRADGTSRVAAVEVLVNTPTVAKLIEEGRTSQIYSAINEGGYWGMQTMNQALLKYFRAGIISEDDADAYAGNRTELKQMMRRGAQAAAATAERT